MSREPLQRVLKVLKVKRLRLDEHLIPIIVEEIEAELAKPEQASTEPPDYVEPPTSDYHNGWEEGFEAARNLYPKKTKREWVGLTAEDQADILGRKWWDFEDSFDVEGFLRLAEQKLKEKNGGS